MKYLKKPQYYAKEYDLHTVELCIARIRLLKSTVKQTEEEHEFPEYTEKELKRGRDQFISRYLSALRLQRYRDRQSTIEKEIEYDRQMQHAYDNSTPPKGLKCNKCKSKLENMDLGHLDYDYKTPPKMIHTFKCDKCKRAKEFYGDGTPYKFKPYKIPCDKCQSPTKTESKEKGDVTTFITTCTKCKHRDISEYNAKTEEKERKVIRKEAEEHYKKSKDYYCMTKEEGEKHLKLFEEIKYANQVYEQELEKYDAPAYEKAEKLNRVSISELKKIINKAITPLNYQPITLKEPIIDRYVIIEFTTQDEDTSRKRDISERELKKVLTEVLEETIWRLLSKKVSYRLGYLTGSLKGYEHDEDILKLFGKQKKKKKTDIDPQLEKRFAGSNLVSIHKMFADTEGKRRLRHKRYKDEPNGFLLKYEDGGRTCKICEKGLRGDECWWRPGGITCESCHNNILKEAISEELLDNEKLWFASRHIQYEFDMHHATVAKHIRNGDLVGKDLVNEEGVKYYTIFLSQDNVKFLKEHKRVNEDRKRFALADDEGKAFYL